MRTCNFVLPFDPVTRQTTLPQAPEGETPYVISYIHLTLEEGSTVVAQVRSDDAIIEAMINDPTYLFLEEIIPNGQQ